MYTVCADFGYRVMRGIVAQVLSQLSFFFSFACELSNHQNLSYLKCRFHSVDWLHVCKYHCYWFILAMRDLKNVAFIVVTCM